MILIIARKYDQSDILLKSYQDCPSEFPVDQDALNLLYAQSLIIRSKYVEAKLVLTNIESLRSSPAGVSTVFALETLTNNAGEKSQDLSYLIEVVQKLSSATYSTEDESLRSLSTLTNIADLFQNVGDHKNASLTYQAALTRTDYVTSTDRLLLTAKLLLSLSFSSGETEFERYSNVLPQVEIRISNIYY